MMRMTVALDRRLLLRSLLAAPAAAGLAPVSFARSGADAILLSVADLHSPYARLPQLVAEVRAIVSQADVPVALIMNGDLFERGNVAATRSRGAADFAALRALARELPVVMNLGNHETAIVDDMGQFVAEATAAGVEVISNLVDRRTGRFFAPVSARLDLGGMELALLGIATDNPMVYRKPARDALTLLDPVSFTADAFVDMTGGSDLPLLVSHAGVSPDRVILPTLGAGALVIGAHDHLDFVHQEQGRTYLHGGAWSRALMVMHLSRTGDGVAVRPELRPIATHGGDTALTELIAGVQAEHLTAEDRALITERAVALDLPSSILLAAEAVRAATQADLAVLGHTTFGAPLDAGPLRRVDFDTFIRFDGGLAIADVPGATIAAIMGRANQHLAGSLDQRTGDFIHAAKIDIDLARTYRLAANSWVVMNQPSYLGVGDLGFAAIDGLKLKAVVAEALAAGL